MTYPPHRRTGSPDKLYEIDDQLEMTVRPESVGGTHAGRMIHCESQPARHRTGTSSPTTDGCGPSTRRTDFPARITAVARHLTDPAGKVYMIDMEGPIWEVDVRTLEAKRLFVKPVPGLACQGRLHRTGPSHRRQQRRTAHARSRRAAMGSAGEHMVERPGGRRRARGIRWGSVDHRRSAAAYRSHWTGWPRG